MEAVTILPETKKENHITEVIENVKVSEGVWHITVKAPKLAQAAKPGQFVQVLVEGAGLLLRRPLGIAGADAEQGTVELFYRVLGKGTAKLTGYRAGDSLSILGPLGHGFDTSAGNVLIVGGGMGLAPTKFWRSGLSIVKHCLAAAMLASFSGRNTMSRPLRQCTSLPMTALWEQRALLSLFCRSFLLPVNMTGWLSAARRS